MCVFVVCFMDYVCCRFIWPKSVQRIASLQSKYAKKRVFEKKTRSVVCVRLAYYRAGALLLNIRPTAVNDDAHYF